MDTLFDIVEWVCTAPFLICGWLFVGFVAGAAARFIMRVEDKPFWSDMILGLLGAGVGALISGAVNFETGDQSGVQEILMTVAVATGGAVVLIFIGRVLSGDQRSRRRKRSR